MASNTSRPGCTISPPPFLYAPLCGMILLLGKENNSRDGAFQSLGMSCNSRHERPTFLFRWGLFVTDSLPPYSKVFATVKGKQRRLHCPFWSSFFCSIGDSVSNCLLQEIRCSGYAERSLINASLSRTECARLHSWHLHIWLFVPSRMFVML